MEGDIVDSLGEERKKRRSKGVNRPIASSSASSSALSSASPSGLSAKMRKSERIAKSQNRRQISADLKGGEGSIQDIRTSEYQGRRCIVFWGGVA